MRVKPRRAQLCWRLWQTMILFWRSNLKGLMRPYLEKLPTSPGASWSMLNRRLDDAIPFQWHHHPEFELTLTLNSIGQRFIGDHTGEYADGDLVLVGPNLPHTWVSRAKYDEANPHIAPLCSGFIRLDPTGDGRCSRAAPDRGNAVSRRRGCSSREKRRSHTRRDSRQSFRSSPAERLLSLLEHPRPDRRATARHALASAPGQRHGLQESRERIDRVLTHLHVNYARTIALEELADIAALSVSGPAPTFSPPHRHDCLRLSDPHAHRRCLRPPFRHWPTCRPYRRCRRL